MDFKSTITGIDDIDKVFANLPASTRRKANMKALRAGAKVVKSMAEENIKAVTSNEATGFLANNIRIYNYRKMRGNFRVGVQVKRGAVNTKKVVNGKPVRVGLYGSVLEYGKSNQSPRSWIRKAIREGFNKAVADITTEMNKRIVEAVTDAKR